MTLTQPIIILVRGLPGSGKSYLTQPLAAAIEQQIGQSVTTLDPDTIDYDSPAYLKHVRRLQADGVDASLHAYRFLRGQAYDSITNRGVVIWNQPFTNLVIFNKMIARFAEQAAVANTSVKILVVEVEATVELAKQRVAKRKQQGGHGPSEATFEQFVHDYVSFADEGFNTTTVHGEDDVDLSVKTIMASLQPLLG